MGLKNTIRSFIVDHNILLKNTFWLSLGEIANKAIFFLVGILLARSLGPEQFGTIGFVKSFVVMFGIIMDFGISKLMVRHTSKDTSKVPEYFINLVFVKGIFGIVVFLAIGTSILLMPKLEIYALFLLMYTGYYVINNINEFIRIVFRPYEKMQHEAILKIVNGLVQAVVFTVIIAYIGVSITNIFWGYLVISICTLLISLVYISRKISFTGVHIKKDIIKSALSSGIFIFLNILFVQLYSSVDSILLGRYNKHKDLGLYNAASKLFNGAMIQVYIASFIPHFLKAPLRTKITKNIKGFLGFGLLVFLGILFFGKYILWLIYGKAYIEGYIYFVLVGGAFIFKFSNSLLSNILISLGYEKKSLIVVIIGAIINITINLILIPRYGGIGACIALIISVLVTFAGNMIYIRRLKNPISNQLQQI